MREVNTRILEISDRWHSNEPVVILCECVRPECVETLPIGRRVIERVIKRGGYTLAVGHEDEDHENVVERRTGYVVVDSIE